MTTPTFPVDPADLPGLKRWLASQEDPRGELRPVEIDEVLIGPDVLHELPSVLQRAGVPPGSSVLVLIDDTLMLRDDVDLKYYARDLLYVAGYNETALHLEGDEYGLVHAAFDHVESVRDYLEDHPGAALVAIGSGTITDIAKHGAYLYDQRHPDRPRSVYVCVQTANSVTAYAASMAVLLKDGVKRTVPSRYPTAIISDLRALASAPDELTVAGVGDCCARFVAYGDWYLASALGMVDFYSEIPLALLSNLDEILLAQADNIAQRSFEGESVVARALLLAGIAQSIVNMSAPISGTEHVTSHVLDMIADHYHRPIALHGAQVGVATLTAADLYQRFLNTFDPMSVNFDACYPDEAKLRIYIRNTFSRIDPSGAMAQECWSDYSKKLALWRQNRPRLEQFCANWQAIHRPKLASLVRGPEIVRRILEQSGAPLTPEQLDPPISQREYDFAVQNGHFIRQRFVLGDLLHFLNWT
ncbi:MAG TPA: iron-containing alcohol dehydrogenase [Ktedonobacteraceae bacterium]|jgi:glycerol-1-phosphate dehydrogenase [NAD(P)+]|nr:iron-containing alcohol dehydrogenase [Ktedonobacteraceae bacterium]